MEIDDILAEASCLIGGNRQDTYGDIDESWERIGKLWAAVLELDEPIPAHTVACMLALMKISRIANDPTHTDNYIDACAYVAGAGQLATS
jgi:hypothetical protein